METAIPDSAHRPSPPASNNWILWGLVGLLALVVLLFFNRIKQQREGQFLLLEEAAYLQEEGRLTTLPTAPAATVADTKKVDNNDVKKASKVVVPIAYKGKTHTHEVSSGESLFRIASRYNVKSDDISAINKLSGGVIKSGQELKIPIQAMHTVAAGEGWYTLLKNYGVPKDLIMRANDLSNENLKVGQELIIPKQ